MEKVSSVSTLPSLSQHNNSTIAIITHTATITTITLIITTITTIITLIITTITKNIEVCLKIPLHRFE